MLPDYIAKAVPNPPANRAPWYINTAPSYAGVFLWVAFYVSIAKDTIPLAPIGVCISAIAVAALLSYGLYYLAPAMLGMKTGFPLYVVGSSTFGTKGGYVMPGLLMGVLQIGWFGVGTYYSTRFILNAFGLTDGPGTVAFSVVGILWGYVMAYIGVMGIQYVAKMALYLNIIPFLMILVVFWQTREGIGAYTPAAPNPSLGFALLIQIIIGFFATAGAAGADFGMNARNEKDVRMGGLIGIAVASMFAAALPLMSVAGAKALHPEMAGLGYDDVIKVIGGWMASAMFFLFTIASIPPACFCAFIAGNSFSTMLPGVKRISSTMMGVTVAILLGITGVAANLSVVFGFVGASFGPICGAMTADYLLSGRKWAGPREGINWAGYLAWALGFMVGILPNFTANPLAQPAAVYSYIVGAVVYAVLAKAGLEPKPVAITAAASK